MSKLPKKLAFLGLAVIGFSNPAYSLPAFPGAEGFGSGTPGGRGGKVIEVTNLNDSGPGSLRTALSASGPRIVVFRVSGTIALKTKITVKNPFLTVAGQTAPAGGITIKNDPSNSTMPLVIKTHDVVLRYLRIRPGPSSKDGGNVDAMDIGSYNIIVDHCSFSWSTDENLTAGTGSHDYTIQWSIISEGLNNSTNPKGPHSKGLLFREAGSDHISAHHNLLAHNDDRNPNINATGVVDFVNNVVYNARRWTEVKDEFGEPKVNLVNNYYKLGPNSDPKKYEVFYYKFAGRHPEVYAKGNIGFHRTSDSLAQDLVVDPNSRWMLVGSPFPAPSVTTYSALDAYTKVLADAGATLPKRDIHDARVVKDVINKTGRFLDDPKQVGGWADMGSGSAPVDKDRDGMPDAWEDANGFNPGSDADGRLDADGDGYTNVEECLNNTDPHAK